MYHGFCNKGGCHVDAKNSPAVTTIPKAQKTGHLKVVTRAHVTTIEVDREGRVTGVTYVTDGVEYFQPAKVVLLASYTYENTRTLLLSKSPAFPNGLSNNHGQVGRHYFSHNQRRGVTALFPKNLNNWYGLPAQGIGVDDFADDNFDHAGLDFIGGGNLWVFSDRRPIGAAVMDTFGKAPTWGSAWKAFIKENADRTNTGVSAEDDAAVRGQLPGSRPDREGSARPAGVPHHGGLQGERTQDRGVHSGQDGGVVSRGRRHRDRCAVRWASMGVATHAYGGTRMGDNADDERRQSLGLFA